MRLTRVAFLLSNQTLDALRNSIRKTISEAPSVINNVKDEQKKIVYDKLVHLNKWYTKVIGLDEVKIYQDRVTSLQDQLLLTQEKRRDVSRQLADIRQKSMILQDQIHKVKRQDEFDKFLDLMKQETEILKLEKSITSTFQDYDRTERELFTAFTNAIRDSHEKQRAQLEYTKYFGLILSIAGSFLAFVYTTVRKHDLKMFMQEKLATIEKSTQPVLENLTTIQEKSQHEIVCVSKKINAVIQLLSSSNNNNNKIYSHLRNDMLVPQETSVLQNIDYYELNYTKIIGATLLTYVILRALIG